jgi:hypothetical protein
VLTRKGTAQHGHRFVRNAHRLNPKVSPDFDDQSGNVRMKVHVLVSIHVVEWQAGRAKSCELRPDFRFDLATNLRKKEKADPGSGHVPIERCIAAEESGNFDIRQYGTAVHQNQMQPNAKFGQSAGPRNRISGSISPDHQARSGKDPVPMRLFDGLIDRHVEPEIVGADDQSPQLVISRPRRNWKNSTPSRKRRRSICGLFTISATREAIF